MNNNPTPKVSLEVRKVAKALGINAGNIAKVEKLWNGCNIHYKNCQKVAGPTDVRMYYYAHHSQIHFYSKKTMKEIVLGELKELV